MQTAMNTLIKRNIKAKFKKSEKEMGVFNKLAQKGSLNSFPENMVPIFNLNLDKTLKDLQKQNRNIEAIKNIQKIDQI
jgi:hypothetical protein